MGKIVVTSQKCGTVGFVLHRHQLIRFSHDYMGGPNARLIG